MWYIFWTINKFLYKLLGPNLSTKFSQTRFGKLVLRLLKGDPGQIQIYSGKDGIRLKLAPHEAEYFGFFHFGSMNLYETAAITRVLHPGDSFIDVGAYVDGWHTIVASRKVGLTGHVYAFEPIPTFFYRLKENIALNNINNVTLEMAAVSDRDGYRTFYENRASSSFYKNHAYQGLRMSMGSLRVKTFALDRYIKVRHIKNLRLIKIDAEGAEMAILKGATKILKLHGAPDLMIEIDDRYLRSGGSSEGELLSYLKKLGYKAYSLIESGLGAYQTKTEGRQLFNVFFSKHDYLIQ